MGRVNAWLRLAIIWGLVAVLAPLANAGYVDNGNGTVTDTVTGLMWQQGDAQNDGGGRTWQEALSYCEGLSLAGYNDWRLPNYRELESLIDESRFNPAINPVFQCRPNNYWSGSTFVEGPSSAWYVGFYNGVVYPYNKDSFASFYVRCARGGPSGYLKSDFNGDGKPDILWRNTATGANRVWYMDGTALLGVYSLPTFAGLNWTMVATGDFNADGKPDILWRNSATGANRVWYMDATTQLGVASLPTVAALNWKIVGTGDFNGDGKTDILWRNTATGANKVWYMNGITQLGVDFLPTAAGLNWKIVGTGDFNADGKPDILWRNTATGANKVWYMDGKNLLGVVSLPALAGLNWKIVGTADFNADSKPDILWRNTATGANRVWYMNGITQLGVDSLPAVANLNWTMMGQ
jgi:hypothetical protein